MEILTYLALVAAAVSVGASVIATLAARRSQEAAANSDVASLAQDVEKLARAVKRDTMRRVRAAAGDVQGPGLEVSAPPELAKPAAPNGPMSKDDLRRMLLGRINR